MNFLCQKCNKQKAAVHIMDTFPEKRERHLCEDCAEQEGVIYKKSDETTNELLQEFLSQQKTSTSKKVTVEDAVCDECGTTIRDFQAKGQLGCPHCYHSLRRVIMPLIQRAHEGADQHVGKVPVRADEQVRKQTDLLRLRRELKDAVDQENYELAARLRDEIQSLESA